MTTCLEKSCSFGLLRVAFINCCQFMYWVISLLVLRAGYGIWLYQFLIIAYLFTLFVLPGDCRFHVFCFFRFIFLCSLSYYISHMNMKHQFVTRYCIIHVTNEHHFIFSCNWLRIGKFSEILCTLDISFCYSRIFLKTSHFFMPIQLHRSCTRVKFSVDLLISKFLVPFEKNKKLW